MNIMIEYAPGIAMAVVAFGLFGYAIALAMAAFVSGNAESVSARLRTWFTADPAQNIGIPCAAISAFAIVAVLLRAFPPSTGADGNQLLLKAFDLEFSGPSGPITLWLMCFLGFVFSMKHLRK
jgi:hypothetical protein